MIENNKKDESNSTTQKKYNTEFVCYHNTPIIFGKLKGKPHSILKEEAWKPYATWVKNQGDEFRYQPTRQYILNNVPLE